MSNQDAMQIRGKIISFITQNGPSLPVQIAKETGLSILFASAFLSEMYGEKEIKMSNLRIGSSPLYFISGQEPQLEKFSQYLKSKEKEAFLILQERKILRDSEQHPAIRVAIREIKDFAIPFEKDNEIFWRYFLAEEPSKKIGEILEVEEIVEPETEIIKVENEEKTEDEEPKEEKEIEDIFEEKKQIPIKEKTSKKSKSSAKSKNQNKKKDENFFNRIKDFLAKEKIEILDIKDFKNDEAVLKVRKEDVEELIFAFNQKKITEKEILKAYKKASQERMKYGVLSLGEPSKKLNDLISAVRDLSIIDKIE